MPILIETARMWWKLGRHDGHGEFRIAGVTGPDEYSAITDNNVYTNLMAARNLRSRRRGRDQVPRGRGRSSDLQPEEPVNWLSAAELDPHSVRRDAAGAPAGRQLHAPRALAVRRHGRSRTTRCCSTIRTSTSTASRSSSRPTSCSRCSPTATTSRRSRRRRNFEYYESITVRDSSLSACGQAIVAAETGHLDLAYEYLEETALRRPAQPRAQHQRRPAPCGVGRHVARPRRRLRRLPRLLRRAVLRAATAEEALAPGLQAALRREQLCWSTSRRKKRPTPWRTAEASSSRTMANRSRSSKEAARRGRSNRLEPPPPVKQPKGRAPGEIRPAGTHLGETGALYEVEGDYAHQSGTAV